MKLEKVDPGDDDVSVLDDTLGYVAQFEGAAAYRPRTPLDAMSMAQLQGAGEMIGRI